MSDIGAIAGAGVNILGQYWLNRSQSRQQRKISLAQWNRENEYNHPAAQMARLKEAGINPHMAYNRGQVDNTAAKIGEMPATDTGGLLSQFADVSLKQAQASNLKAHSENLRQKTATEKLTTALTGAKAKHAQLEQYFFEDSYDTRQSLLDAQLVNSVLDANLKEFEKKLNSQGMTKQDGLHWRQLFELANEAGLDFKSFYHKHKTTIDQIFGKEHFEALQKLLKDN